MITNQEIAEYYDFSRFDYQLYSGSWRNISMHYGIWDETTRSHGDALLNENRVVALIGRISARERVLDIGCGYGTTAVWLARNVGCRVVGITISGVQSAAAKDLAKRCGVSHLVTVIQADFHAIPVNADDFDVVMGIESTCHSSRKEALLKELSRVTKEGGRLVIADAYYRKDPESLSVYERELVAMCFKGVHIPPPPQLGEFRTLLGEAGFRQIRWDDKTLNILPTAKRAYWFGKLLKPFGTMLAKVGVRSLNPEHLDAFVSQYAVFRTGLGVYGIFSAVKS